MSDIGSFLRYIIPGILFALTSFLFMFILIGTDVIDFLRSICEGKEISSVVVALFGSGTVGYICSTVYFYLLWSPKIAPKYAQDHKEALATAQQHRLIFATDINGNHLNLNEIGQRQAWRVLNSIWYSLRKEDNAIAAVNVYVDRLCNIQHGLGASSIALCFGLIISLGLYFGLYMGAQKDPILSIVASIASCKLLLVIAIFIFLFIIIRQSHKSLNNDICAIVNSSFLSFMVQQKKVLEWRVDPR